MTRLMRSASTCRRRSCQRLAPELNTFLLVTCCKAWVNEGSSTKKMSVGLIQSGSHHSFLQPFLGSTSPCLISTKIEVARVGNDEMGATTRERHQKKPSLAILVCSLIASPSATTSGPPGGPRDPARRWTPISWYACPVVPMFDQ